MRNRRKIFIALACAIAVGALAWIVTRDREPTYDGESLTYFVLRSPPDYSPQAYKAGERVAKAIEQIGTNAIPYLIKWLQYEEPKPNWKTQLRATVRRRLGKDIFNSTGIDRASLAPLAFQPLGPKADPAIPELTRLANQSKTGNVPKRAIWALALIRTTNALPPLINIVTNRQHSLRKVAVDALRFMGDTARPALPIIIDCLKDADLEIARAAASTLGVLKLEPELVVPALIQALQDSRPEVQTMVALALKEFGTAARPAIPALQKLLDASNPNVMISADSALRRIAPEVLTNSPSQ
jgi:hypothetical protein